MVVQPSIEAYDALLKRVKTLEEENKRLRNEKNETSRSTAEVELKDRKTNIALRNSWADIYNENTTLHKTKKLLGQEVKTDDSLEWRVKWGQRGAGTFSLLGVICWIGLRQELATIVFGVLCVCCMCILQYKNISIVIAKRLLRETNVVLIVVLGLCNWSIDIVLPANAVAPLNGFFYTLILSIFVFVDAVKVKSRMFVIAIGIIFVLASINVVYNLIFGNWSKGVILFKYTIQENEYTFMKRSTKRSIFLQLLFFSMNGIYTLFKDSKQELMIFATGHIYRETGTASKKAEQKISVTKSRNSWTDIYNETTALRKHKRLLGQEVNIDDNLVWRVKWGQRGTGVSGLLAVICWVAGQIIATIVFGALVLVFTGILYYKNVSFVIMKRLLRESNVVIIIILALCVWMIDIARPATLFSSSIGFTYVLLVFVFVFLDAVKVKSRVFLLVLGVLFVLSNFNNIYHLIFGNWDQGVILLNYSIQGNKYTFMKRSTQRSIYIQIMLFSMNGIYTIFKDSKQELMIFATGHIYRETGTASKDVEQKTFVQKIKSEKSISV